MTRVSGITETPSGLLIATDGKDFPYSCPWCDKNFTDEEFQNRTYVRHVERCVDMDKVEEHIEIRRSDPISIKDSEQIKWLREEAAGRKMKGVTGSKRRKPKDKVKGY